VIKDGISYNKILMINPRNAGNYIFANRKGFEFSVTFPEDCIVSSFIGKY
jgi:hypothetical protein